MLAQVHSAAVLGVDGFGVTVEVNVGLGLPGVHFVGLGASAVKEGAVRVRAALQHAGFSLPPRKVVINLAPADIKKDGAAFDLPIAIGVLVAHEIIPASAVEGVVFLGELGLDGSLRRVSGALPVGMYARAIGARALVLPRASAGEAAGLDGLEVLQAGSISEVVTWLRAEGALAPAMARPRLDASRSDDVDLADVRGLEYPKLALEVAAAGGHNLLFVGAPGAGKSMLARRLATILPPLDDDEALEASVIWSVAGQLDGAPRLGRRPFRAPHHEVSVQGLIGGGAVPRPGEISLAHHGVLFLDELPEFKRPALEALRQPLEERQVTIVRARAAVRFPASFALVAAMNPCPCGYHDTGVRACTCDVGRVRAYRGRLSGPLLDRFDIQVRVPPTDLRQLTAERAGEPSARVRERVVAARVRQRERLRGTPFRSNAELGARDLERVLGAAPGAVDALLTIVERRGLSPRALHRLLRVGRTIADLAGRDEVRREDLLCAVEFRCLDQ